MMTNSGVSEALWLTEVIATHCACPVRSRGRAHALSCCSSWTGLSLGTGTAVRGSMLHYGWPGLINACHCLVNTYHSCLRLCSNGQLACHTAWLDHCCFIHTGDSSLTGFIRAFIRGDGKGAGHSGHICLGYWDKMEKK